MPVSINASIAIPPDLHARIKSLADLRNQSVGAVTREALEAYVIREEKREAWKKEGAEAWEEYQENGLHLTNGEVVGWMDKIIAGEKAQLPECHM